MKRSWAGAALASLAALLALGGCAPTTRLTAVSATGTPRATLAATATRQPTPTDAPTQAPETALTFDPVRCPSVPPSNDVLTYQRVGDMLFLTDQATFFYTTVVQVPDGVPAAPLVEPDAPGQYPSQWRWPVNPGELVFSVCNMGAQTKTLQAVSLRLTALTPYGGSLNVWNRCDTLYQQPGGVQGNLCGDSGWQGPALLYTASFGAGAGAGATVDLAPDPQAAPSFPLPIALPPGQGVSVGVNVSAYPQPGLYRFALGARLDGAAPVFSAETRTVVLAHVARTWDGRSCEAPAMQSQLPAPGSAPTYYICPKG